MAVRPKIQYLQLFGLCDNREGIIVDTRQSQRNILDTTIHELLHWYFPHLTEKQVLDYAASITADLWASGWRNPGIRKGEGRTIRPNR